MRRYSFFLLLITQQSLMAQTMEDSDTFKFNYRTLPSLGNHQWDNITFNVKYSIEPGQSFHLELEGTYRNDRFTFFNISAFDKEILERFHTIELKAGLEKIYRNKWAIGLKIMPRLASNFSISLSNNDLLFNHGISLRKNWVSEKHSYSIVLGAERNTYLGAPRYLPILAFGHQINNTLGYTIGFPRSDLRVKLNNRHQFSATASFEGVYFNNSYPSFLFEDQAVENHTKLVYSELALGLSHNYRLQPRITAHIQIGYSLRNPLELENSDSATFFDFQTNGTAHFSMGLIYNLKQSSNE